ncbi:MAG: type II secretion system protein [Microgenomates group bacterium]|jgi:type IV pilus assembly protein PilA|nr:MAG: prepilin-type N-terminal cleavage/methylation domain-containing protein [Candidatus Roizmanbacteria bacterium]
MIVMRKASQKAGFTLVELLVAIGIFGVLVAITIVAINPGRQFSRANNTKRQSDVTALLDALGQYSAENSGRLPATITTTNKTVSNTGADICGLLVPNYLSALPVDPGTNNGTAISSCAGAYTTNYEVALDASGRLMVTAPATELGGAVITATR